MPTTEKSKVVTCQYGSSRVSQGSNKENINLDLQIIFKRHVQLKFNYELLSFIGSNS